MSDLMGRVLVTRAYATVNQARATVQQIRRFADREGEASGLPGQDQGPADAYRHLVGVAEPARRFGRYPGAALAEYNELRSYEAMRRAESGGRPVPPSNTPEARAMDRHNNRLAIEIGATSRSTEEVVTRARAAMERAIQSQGGSGHANTPYWREVRHWSEGTSLSDWSRDKWPDLETSNHFRSYRAAATAVRGRPERTSAGGGPVQVSPHIRDGRQVSGHTRSAPAR